MAGTGATRFRYEILSGENSAAERRINDRKDKQQKPRKTGRQETKGPEVGLIKYLITVNAATDQVVGNRVKITDDMIRRMFA